MHISHSLNAEGIDEPTILQVALLEEAENIQATIQIIKI